MSPKTTAQNLLLWGAALLAAIVLAVIKGVATNWPEDGGIDWRGVYIDVAGTIVTVAPLVLAGLGLPMLGKEAVTSLASQVGAQQARAALEVEAVKQATGLPPTQTDTFTPEQVDQIARRVLELRDQRAADRLRNAQADPADAVIGMIDRAESGRPGGRS